MSCGASHSAQPAVPLNLSTLAFKSLGLLLRSSWNNYEGCIHVVISVNASVQKIKRVSDLSVCERRSPKISVGAPKRTAALVLDHANKVANTEEPGV